MIVQSYLYNRATNAVLSDEEKSSIATSIDTIRRRLNAYFNDTLLKHFAFGSYTRNTILQRFLDAESDVDYMVFFELVSALDRASGYNIPDGSGGWMLTTPNKFNSTLTDKNKTTNSRLKPAIRFAKIWNADRGYPFASYPMEQQAAGFSYGRCADTVMAHFFRLMDKLVLPSASAQWRVDRPTRVARDNREHSLLSKLRI
ncbi:MAG: nucleotidyltransferase [Candidatus Devosia euplotis]|nr:nucleotidyltransferase [Candidatus Devosia euplotis]